jgi:ABC-type nitrate/sulfonate/bicarbonate transport system substrate-binding protein
MITAFKKLYPLVAAAIVLTMSASSAYSQSNPADVGTIRLGWVKSTANLMAAVSPQLSSKHGLKIDSINFNTAQDILTAMIGGQIDVGLLTPIHLLRAIDTKIDVVQVSGNTRGNTGIVARKSLGLRENDWNQLKSLSKTKMLKVASSRGSINEMLALAVFSLNGVDPNKDIELINIANFAQHPQALRSGEFDLIITLEPLAAATVVDGVGTLFARPYNSPAGDLNTNYVVMKGVATNNPQGVKAFVATLVDAARYLSEKDKELEVAIKLTGLKPEILHMALANNRYELRNGVVQMQALAKLAAQVRFTSRDVTSDVPKFVDDRFLKEAGVTP